MHKQRVTELLYNKLHRMILVMMTNSDLKDKMTIDIGLFLKTEVTAVLKVKK